MFSYMCFCNCFVVLINKLTVYLNVSIKADIELKEFSISGPLIILSTLKVILLFVLTHMNQEWPLSHLGSLIRYHLFCSFEVPIYIADICLL